MERTRKLNGGFLLLGGMNSVRGTLRRATALAVCIVLAISLCPCAFADSVQSSGEPYSLTVFEDEELTALVQDFIKTNKLKDQKFSLGFIYTGTGESWYYNGDTFFYSASMYKVPLMMLVAEKVKNGEIDEDYAIKNEKLSYLQEMILTYSSNDFAHMVMDHFWSERECRTLQAAYTGIPAEDLPDNYYESSFFSARFMTEVMYTLYSEPERFPGVLDCLKNAQPKQYFRHDLEGEYEIAQKYGSYEGVNHTSGIIYMDNPIILTVMTKSATSPEPLLGRAADMMVEYTKTLDERLEAKRAEEAEAQKKAELAAQQRAEQAAMPEPTQQPAESAVSEQTNSQTAQLTDAVKAAAEKPEDRHILVVLGGGAAAVVLIVAYLIRSAVKKSKNRSYSR